MIHREKRAGGGGAGRAPRNAGERKRRSTPPPRSRKWSRESRVAPRAAESTSPAAPPRGSIRAPDGLAVRDLAPARRDGPGPSAALSPLGTYSPGGRFLLSSFTLECAFFQRLSRSAEECVLVSRSAFALFWVALASFPATLIFPVLLDAQVFWALCKCGGF